FFFQAEDGIRDLIVTGVQTCALPIFGPELSGEGGGGQGPGLDDARRGRRSGGEPAARHQALRRENRSTHRRAGTVCAQGQQDPRSEERRVGKESRSQGAGEQRKKEKG